MRLVAFIMAVGLIVSASVLAAPRLVSRWELHVASEHGVAWLLNPKTGSVSTCFPRAPEPRCVPTPNAGF